ncbi:hypothetical protein BKA69DRAFT_1101575 [Paraphysoderma sedebokerense]|nr:hypothetical protein BKA69DRAFT_1101575 [Paraphysoderma sedebokerense]
MANQPVEMQYYSSSDSTSLLPQQNLQRQISSVSSQYGIISTASTNALISSPTVQAPQTEQLYSAAYPLGIPTQYHVVRGPNRNAMTVDSAATQKSHYVIQYEDTETLLSATAKWKFYSAREFVRLMKSRDKSTANSESGKQAKEKDIGNPLISVVRETSFDPYTLTIHRYLNSQNNSEAATLKPTNVTTVMNPTIQNNPLIHVSINNQTFIIIVKKYHISKFEIEARLITIPNFEFPTTPSGKISNSSAVDVNKLTEGIHYVVVGRFIGSEDEQRRLNITLSLLEGLLNNVMAATMATPGFGPAPTSEIVTKIEGSTPEETIQILINACMMLYTILRPIKKRKAEPECIGICFGILFCGMF